MTLIDTVVEQTPFPPIDLASHNCEAIFLLSSLGGGALGGRRYVVPHHEEAALWPK